MNPFIPSPLVSSWPPVVVGRSLELERVGDILKADGDLLLTGVPGIGRRTLVRSAARQVGARVVEIDAAIADFTRSRSVAEVLAMLDAADVPGGRIYTVKDIAEDAHYRARDMIVSVTTADGLALEAPGVVPKLSATPGRITRRAPSLGEDTAVVLNEIGVTPEQLAALRARGVL